MHKIKAKQVSLFIIDFFKILDETKNHILFQKKFSTLHNFQKEEIYYSINFKIFSSFQLKCFLIYKLETNRKKNLNN